MHRQHINASPMQPMHRQCNHQCNRCIINEWNDTNSPFFCEINCFIEKTSAQHNMAGLGGSFDSLLDDMMRKKWHDIALKKHTQWGLKTLKNNSHIRTKINCSYLQWAPPRPETGLHTVCLSPAVQACQMPHVVQKPADWQMEMEYNWCRKTHCFGGRAHWNKTLWPRKSTSHWVRAVTLDCS